MYTVYGRFYNSKGFAQISCHYYPWIIRGRVAQIIAKLSEVIYSYTLFHKRALPGNVRKSPAQPHSLYKGGHWLRMLRPLPGILANSNNQPKTQPQKLLILYGFRTFVDIRLVIFHYKRIIESTVHISLKTGYNRHFFNTKICPCKNFSINQGVGFLVNSSRLLRISVISLRKAGSDFCPRSRFPIKRLSSIKSNLAFRCFWIDSSII